MSGRSVVPAKLSADPCLSSVGAERSLPRVGTNSGTDLPPRAPSGDWEDPPFRWTSQSLAFFPLPCFLCSPGSTSRINYRNSGFISQSAPEEPHLRKVRMSHCFRTVNRGTG